MSDYADRVARLIWTTDTSSAVRGLRHIAVQSQETKDRLKTDANESSLALERTTAATHRLRDGMMSLAGFVGIGGVAFGLKDLVHDGEALQTQQSQLATALRDTGQAAQGTQERLQRMAEGLSTRGGFTTTENLAALTQFVRETHSASEAQKLLALSTNIGRANNMGLAESSQLVARAYTGQIGRLQKLMGPMEASKVHTIGLTVAHEKQIATLENEAQMMGKMGNIWLRQQEINDHLTNQEVNLAALKDKHATATEFLTAAQKEFAGATSAYADKTEGKTSDLSHNFQNLTEELGKGLLPTMNDVVDVGSKIADWMSHNTDVVLGLSAAFGALGSAMLLDKAIRGIIDLGRDIEKAAVKFGILGDEGLLAGEKTAKGAAIADEALATEGGAAGGGRLAALLGGAGLLAGVGVGGYMLAKSGAGNPLAFKPGEHPVGLSMDHFNPGGGFSGGGRMAGLSGFEMARPAAPTTVHVRNSQPIHVSVDGREILRTVVHQSLMDAARGPTSFVGGSLVTGAPGLPATGLATR